MSKALVVLSGGQDSTTCAFWAKQRFSEVHAVTFDYGQSHSIELDAARDIGRLVGVKSHEFVKLGPVLKSTSPLVNPEQQLEIYNNYAEMDKIIGDRVEKTFVPMRNALFLTLAANRAVDLGCMDLVTGVCQADNANYPDCRSDFIHSMECMIAESLGIGVGRFRIFAPLMHMSKAESIKLARQVGAYYALAFTHTAYDGKYPPTGQDHASTLRAHGFEEVGLPDPLVIRAVLEGLMNPPATANYIGLDSFFREVEREVQKLGEWLANPSNGRIGVPAFSLPINPTTGV